MALRVVELYFFEEISRTCSKEAGFQWLLKETKRKKCGMQGEIAVPENMLSIETNRQFVSVSPPTQSSPCCPEAKNFEHNRLREMNYQASPLDSFQTQEHKTDQDSKA
jgi:hypothetical protein